MNPDALNRLARTLNTLAPLVWAFACLSPFVGTGFAAFFYRYHRLARPDPDRRFPVAGYVVALIVCALVAFPIGMFLGAQWGCTLPYQGNLCFLWGVFFGGPLASGIAIFVVGWLITLAPADVEPVPPVKAWTLASVSRRLWRGQYSLGAAFWGFFLVGHFVALAVGGLVAALCLFVVPALAPLPFRLVPLAYAIIAAVGVWRSAGASGSVVTRLAGRTLAVVGVVWVARLYLLLLIGGWRLR